MPAKKPTRVKQNGNIITLKGLTTREYMSIHRLPRGHRNRAGRALLLAAAAYATKNPQWFLDAERGVLELVRRGM